MKLELHFKAIVEVEENNSTYSDLYSEKEFEIYFPFVFGKSSIVKDILKRDQPIFKYSGYSLSPELDDQLKKLNT